MVGYKTEPIGRNTIPPCPFLIKEGRAAIKYTGKNKHKIADFLRFTGYKIDFRQSTNDKLTIVYLSIYRSTIIRKEFDLLIGGVISKSFSNDIIINDNSI